MWKGGKRASNFKFKNSKFPGTIENVGSKLQIINSKIKKKLCAFSQFTY